MNLRSFIESKYSEQTREFVESRTFTVLENGAVERRDYDKFVANLCRTHLKSPQILAFLYSASPPASQENIKHNMLEELGLDDAGVSHPELLFILAEAADFDRAARNELESGAQEELRRMASDPILFGTLKEVGLSVLLETTAFEWMLSRAASRIAAFLAKHRQLTRESLEWFHHHSEVDIRHAEEGLQAVVDYVEFYEFDADEIEVIFDVTFRENVFIKRYFSEFSLAEQAGI